MNRDQIVTQLKTLIAPYVEDRSVFETLSETSELVNHLHINSLHLIDIVLDVESTFDIEITADEADNLRTIGSVLDLIEGKRSRAVA
jgi:acyl carrier protein